MKKSDLAMIILIASVSALIAFTIANSLPFLKVPSEGGTVKTISKYNEEITNEPSSEVFNANAINPTVKTVIGSGTATQ